MIVGQATSHLQASARRATALALAGVLAFGTGCSSFREIPRTDYAAHPEYPHVRVVTNDGRKFEFDTAKVQGDTLTGYRRRDTPGPLDEYDTVALPMDEVVSLRARRIDWYRTGLVGGLVLGAVVIGGLAAHSAGNDGGNNDPTPCRNCSPAHSGRR